MSQEFGVVSVIFCIFLMISHIFIPQWNQGEDYFIFSQWSLFSDPPRGVVTDISWDDGQTFLFRDHRGWVKRSGVNIHTLFSLLRRGAVQRLQKDYCLALMGFSKKQPIAIFRREGRLWDHLLAHKKMMTLEKQIICNDI